MSRGGALETRLEPRKVDPERSDRPSTERHRAIPMDKLDGLLAFSGGAIPNVKQADAVEAVRLAASLAERRRQHANEG